MTTRPLDILYVSPMPPSPPRFGAQARMHGLGRSLAERHHVTALSLYDEDFDPVEVQLAMAEYCREVVLVHTPGARRGGKRIAQFASLFSGASYQRRWFTIPGLQEQLNRLLLARRYDLVFMHFPYLAHYQLRCAPNGQRPPTVILDSHDIGYDLARQVARSQAGLGRRFFAAANWKKLAREELDAYRGADGVLVCSRADQARLAADAPTVRTKIIPNAADVEFFRPRPTDPPPDGNTVLFFGLLSTVPNVDGVTFFLKEIWPRIVARRPGTRCKIVGGHASASLLALGGPGVEFTGMVEDLRPHLAAAAAVVVPLRLGSGTRLKIVEAWAMSKPIVSTTLGAEGIDGVDGRDLLIANESEAFADATLRVLDQPGLAKRLGAAGRAMAEDRYSWRAAGTALERFVDGLIGSQAGRSIDSEGS